MVSGRYFSMTLNSKSKLGSWTGRQVCLEYWGKSHRTKLELFKGKRLSETVAPSSYPETHRSYLNFTARFCFAI